MSRQFVAAAAQLGPIAREEPRESAVARMLSLLHQAHARGATLVVFPELALTSFFPRWWISDEAALDHWFESAMPNAVVQPLFDAARGLGIDFYLGYAERVEDNGQTRYFNTAILVSAEHGIVGRYRKIHLPGHADHKPERPFQHLEKRYFERGDLGFPVYEHRDARIGMCICNDRRWPETFRLLGLGGAEIVLLGYNTPRHYPPAPEHDHLQDFHNHLCMQAGAYANGCWVIATAKAGIEEDCELIGGSCVIAPTGERLSVAAGQGDELVCADINLDRCREIREHIFNFTAHRQPDVYSALVK